LAGSPWWGSYIHHGLGYNTSYCEWSTFVRDLAADLTAAEPGNTIIEVNRLLVRGSGRMDDIVLSGGVIIDG